MDLKNRLILEEYRKNLDDFQQMNQIINQKLKQLARESDINTFSIQSRVKRESSLAEKLVRHDGWYTHLCDLTDVLGGRVICYFSDDVDRVGDYIEQYFDVDWSDYEDKRESIDAESFGYASLHYTCQLPKCDDYPERLCEWRFEIQVRTTLQHVWSDIEHDLGYKSEFGVPRAVQRGFARVSALLELADDEFVRIRDLMNGYTESVRASIVEGTADDVPIDLISLNEYVRHNKGMRALLDRMAQLSGAQIEECDPGAYVAQLAWLDVVTIGGLSRLLEANEEMACKMLSRALESTDLDIISSSTGLRYLCHAELCRRGLDVERVAEFLALSLRNPERAKTRAGYLLRTYEELAGE